MLDLDSSFADYGNIVSGKRFIRRSTELEEIESRVVRPPGGNLAIIGQRRVGKSSLAYQSVLTRRDDLLGQRILPIRVSVSTYDTSAHLFYDLASICFRELEEQGWDIRLIREAIAEVRACNTERFSFGVLKDFFNETHDAGFRVVFILDEFDKSSRFFAGDNAFFDRLRELSYRGETTLLTISRSPIAHIEEKSNITSTLAGVFHDLYLGMFTKQEIGEHFERLAAAGVSLGYEQQQQIVAQCGGHPLLHDKVAFELIQLYRRDKKVSLDEAFRRSQRVFLREFECIVDHLREKELLDAVMQILFASPTGLRQTLLHEIESYGLIREAERHHYTAFSTAFRDYLSQELPLPVEDLSSMEQRVLRFLAGDMQNRQIAVQLDVSPHTIKTHVANILRKLQVSSRQEAVRRARELEIID